MEVAFDCELPFVFFLFVFFSKAFCFFRATFFDCLDFFSGLTLWLPRWVTSSQLCALDAAIVILTIWGIIYCIIATRVARLGPWRCRGKGTKEALNALLRHVWSLIRRECSSHPRRALCLIGGNEIIRPRFKWTVLVRNYIDSYLGTEMHYCVPKAILPDSAIPHIYIVQFSKL